MKDIKCPNCGTAFHVDESTYQTIVSQVRNHLFEEELSKRSSEIAEKVRSQEHADRIKAEREFDSHISQKNLEISTLQNSITELRGIISSYEAKKEAELQAIKADATQKMADALAAKEKVIAGLENRIMSKDNEHALKILETRNEGENQIRQKDREIFELKAQLKTEQLSAENRENQLREYHKLQLEDKQSEIDRLKDFKQRLSTKMIGETLEQHCFIQFAQAQSMGLYPEASFEKDNIVAEGSKGDFIFRDYIDGEEYVSVMFEMKNEMDTTATKHRNDDFLDKLDKDRRRKDCEFAVLVSMLEQGNELYDNGIVDKSYRFPKMMVIRPQFFLPLLRLLSEGARKGFLEKRSLIKELAEARNESLDLSRFQDKLDKVRNALNSNYAAAHKKFTDACNGIDKAIEALEKQIKNLRDIKASFEASDQRLLKSTQVGEEELTIKKLTHGNPTVRKLIKEADQDS